MGRKVLIRHLSQLKRNIVVVGRRNYRPVSSVTAYDRFQVATGLATIVEPAAQASEANVHLHFLNPLEIVRSNILLVTAKRPLAKGEKLSMDLFTGHFDASTKAPVTDTELFDFEFGGQDDDDSSLNSFDIWIFLSTNFQVAQLPISFTSFSFSAHCFLTFLATQTHTHLLRIGNFCF